MVEIRSTYEGDLRCKATHPPSHATLLTDAPVDNHGKGESFSPTDLVATALGTCMLTVMGIAAKHINVELRGAACRVEKIMSATGPRRIARLGVVFTIPGSFTDEQKQKLQHAAMTCPVHKSLHPEIEIPVQFQWA